MPSWYGLLVYLESEQCISTLGCIHSRAGNPMQRFTDTGLDYAVNGRNPVVVAFSASWCRSSTSLAAALERVGETMGDRVMVGVVEVDEEPGVPPRYGVRGLPTTVLLKDGAVASTRVGELSRRQLQDWIDDHV